MITGLPVEETPDRLVIKTADGQRVSLEPRSIEDRRTSDVSLMPEGLAQTMTDAGARRPARIPDHLARPVSIVGQYHAIGPVNEPNGTRLVDPASRLDWTHRSTTGAATRLSWRRFATTPKARPI